MLLSIIIPVHNAQNTLRECLQSIYSADYNSREVILIDDASTDNSLNIAKEFPCRIIHLDGRQGQGYARNQGIKQAKGEILVFIDADIVIKKDALDIIKNTFISQLDTYAMVGILSKETKDNSFFSKYKNLYMFYNFSNLAQNITFIYGGISALRNTGSLGFDPRIGKGEDTELGQRIAAQGLRIKLNKNLEVKHLKKYSLFTLIKNDFLIASSWIKIFLRYCGFKELMNKKGFAHANLIQVSSIMLISLSLIVLPLSKLFIFSPWISILSLLMLISINYRFLAFLLKEKGILFSLLSIIVLILDYLVMSLGIIYGLINSIFVYRKSG